tara:strand:- start:155 stop:310 length:156 start_codon:yes stop_codon:yes gene_type:complete
LEKIKTVPYIKKNIHYGTGKKYQYEKMTQMMRTPRMINILVFIKKLKRLLN